MDHFPEQKVWVSPILPGLVPMECAFTTGMNAYIFVHVSVLFVVLF